MDKPKERADGEHADLPRPGPIDLYIAQQAEPIRQLMEMSRIFLHGAAPGLREGIKWRIPTFMMEHNVFYLNPQNDHVVLGFSNGAKMPEFRAVFDRVQAEVAHVVVRSIDDLKRPGLRAAVRAAAGFPPEGDTVALRDAVQLGTAARDAAMRSLPAM